MRATLTDRLLGRTGWRRRDAQTWAAMEKRVAAMDAQDELIARVTRQRDEAIHQRDEQRSLVAATALQVEEFRVRVTAAEERADRAEASATRARAQVANLSAITIPMCADAPTLEMPITPVRTLQDALGAA